MLLFTPLLSENLYAEKTHQGTSKNVRCVRLNSVKKSTLIKAFHRTSFPTKEITTYFEKTVTQNKPVFARRKTTRGFARKNCTLTKPFRGASFRRLGCSASCAEILTELCALRRSHICANPLLKGEYPYSKVRKKSTGNISARTLALYHIKLSMSIEI